MGEQQEVSGGHQSAARRRDRDPGENQLVNSCPQMVPNPYYKRRSSSTLKNLVRVGIDSSFACRQWETGEKVEENGDHRHGGRGRDVRVVVWSLWPAPSLVFKGSTMLS